MELERVKKEKGREIKEELETDEENVNSEDAHLVREGPRFGRRVFRMGRMEKDHY